jgi:hypothetical protein
MPALEIAGHHKKEHCMKNTIKIFIGIAIIAIIGFSVIACGGGGRLSGTYTDEKGTMSYTFSGNKVTAEMFGQKGEATYELKDGKFTMFMPDGRTESYDYTLEGNTLTFNWYGQNIVLTKK